MKRFFKNCKGAVTVMVSLLLIPSILITGTGVDLARIYTARSIVQDANQLAANSVLTSYNALLQDLYGLFGFMQDDPELADLVDAYVRVAVFGEEADAADSNRFSLFSGSNLEVSSINAAPNKHLANEAVLRRQIEEYAKFRAPAIIVKLIMDKLDTFEKIQEDAKVIDTKLEVDDGVDELEKYYRKIYDRVGVLNKCRNDQIAYMSVVSTAADDIQDLFGDMKTIQNAYATAAENYDDAKDDYDDAEDESAQKAAKELMDTYEKQALAQQLKYQDTYGRIKEASKTLEENIEAYEKILKEYIEHLEDLRKECEKAQEKKDDLKRKIVSLRSSLDSGKCSDTLVDGLMGAEKGQKSVIEQYEDLLKHDVEAMGVQMEALNKPQIEKTIELMKNASLDSYLLTKLQDLDFETTFPIDSDDSNQFASILSANTTFLPDKGERGNGFVKFEEVDALSKLFYEELVRIYNSEEGKGADKAKLDDAVTKIFKKSQDVFGGLIFIPEGAKYLANAENTSDADSGTDFGTGDNWGKQDAGKEDIQSALDADFLSKLAEPLDGIGNKILLMVYDTEMFSDASTPGQDEKEEDGSKSEYPKKNMAGIPLTTEVNYYFQSELEYLYNGNLKEADANLRSVAGMIFLVRFVMDYVASFTIPEINNIVNSVKSALAWTGPLAILAGELARLGLSIGEAAIDVARLRSGDEVAIFKDKYTWKLSITGLINAATEGVSQSAIDGAFSMESKSGDDEDTPVMAYTDYLRLFLLLVPEDDLAYRTGKLIELNVTNYRDKIGADEAKMERAEQFDLSKAITDFSITTTVDMRMLFLSMPFAQEGINGVIPPKTFPIVITDYRGY